MFCKDCDFWGKKAFYDTHRECSKLSNGLSGGLLSCATGDESEPFVTTATDFGCILFKKANHEN